MLGRALTYAYLGTSLWLAGYLYGHHVAGQDSDPEPYQSEFEIVDELHRHAHAEGNGG